MQCDLTFAFDWPQHAGSDAVDGTLTASAKYKANQDIFIQRIIYIYTT